MMKKFMVLVIFTFLTCSNLVTVFGSSSENDSGKGEVGERKRNEVGWYFEYPDGSLALDKWVHANNNWYYFDNEGYMVTDWNVIDGNLYYFYVDLELEGVMASDTIIDDMQIPTDGKIEEGGMWKEDDIGRYYEFISGSVLSDKWVQINNNFYYFDSERYMATDWNVIDGNLYYFYVHPELEGIMASDTIINDMQIPTDGKIEEGGMWKEDDIGRYYEFISGSSLSDKWVQIDSQWYYFDDERYIETGWNIIDGIVYYFYTNPESEGIMASNTIINNKPVLADGKVDSDGLYEMAIPVLDQIGWDLRSAYNWVGRFPYVRMYNSSVLGKVNLAKHGFENRSGNCYVAAATLGTLSELIGYETHLVKGMVPKRSGGLTEHSWLEITVNGVTRVYDVNFFIETGYNGYAINYGQSGTWRYTDYTYMD